MLKMRLERIDDFEVLTSNDSEQGYELALAERPDLILMDLEMPVVDRWEPVRTLKNDPQTRHKAPAPQRAGDCARQQARPHRLGGSPQRARFRVRQNRCDGVPTCLIHAPRARGVKAWPGNAGARGKTSA